MATKKRPVSRSSASELGEASRDIPEAIPPARNRLAAADFFSAVQRSLDTAQRQLSAANNSFADFVVKEFKIDAAVQLQSNDLGVLQILLADDKMPAHSLSRLTLTLAAVAKTPGACPPKTMGAADAISITELAWLPARVAEQLASYKVKTISEFLGLAADARFSTRLTSLLKVERAELGRWVSQMRLFELPEMTSQFAAILAKFEIANPGELSRLTDKSIADLETKTSRVLTTEMLTKWREAAKQLAN